MVDDPEYRYKMPAVFGKIEGSGNGNHVRAAFEAGKKAGLFTNGDTVVIVHTLRNEAGVKEVRPG